MNRRSGRDALQRTRDAIRHLRRSPTHQVIRAAGGALLACASGAWAMEVPPELAAFVDPGSQLIALQRADLNADGLEDCILVLERTDFEGEVGQRSLKILLGRRHGGLRVDRENTKAILCSTCGGPFGDPLSGLELKPRGFSIEHYGGSSWRWSKSYVFEYFPADTSWRLVLIEESHFHSSDPEQVETRTYRPPSRQAGVDLSEFDPREVTLHESD